MVSLSRLSGFIAGFANRGHSGLDIIIHAHIKRDEFQRTLERIASFPNVKTILEIGSSDGRGSTVGLAKGMLKNPSHPQLHAVEFAKRRHARLERRYRRRSDIHCHNVVTVSRSEFLTPKDISEFSHRHAANFYNGADPDQVEREFNDLLQESNLYIEANALQENGIKSIKQKFGIDTFDFVLIDGGPFSGDAELEQTIGAKYIALDDIFDIKNYKAHQRLLDDPAYEMVCYSKLLRAGFSIFRRKNA